MWETRAVFSLLSVAVLMMRGVTGQAVQHSAELADTADALLFLLDNVLQPVITPDAYRQGIFRPVRCPNNTTLIGSSCIPDENYTDYE